MARVVRRRTSNPTPGNSQYQLPRHAPRIPPIIMQADANKPMLAHVTAKLEPESDIIPLGNTVIRPRNTPTNNTAARLPTQHIKLYVCRGGSVAIDDGSMASESVDNGTSMVLLVLKCGWLHHGTRPQESLSRQRPRNSFVCTASGNSKDLKCVVVVVVRRPSSVVRVN